MAVLFIPFFLLLIIFTILLQKRVAKIPRQSGSRIVGWHALSGVVVSLILSIFTNDLFRGDALGIYILVWSIEMSLYSFFGMMIIYDANSRLKKAEMLKEETERRNDLPKIFWTNDFILLAFLFFTPAVVFSILFAAFSYA